MCEINFVPDWHNGAGISGLGSKLKKLCGQQGGTGEIAHFEPCLPIGAHVFRPPMSSS